MGTSRYITSTNHAATLRAAMTDFHRALTYRWREQVCQAVMADSHDYPTRFRRSISPHGHQALWDYRTPPARAHLTSPGGCNYVKWVNAAQNGPLSGVRCDGSTGAARNEYAMVVDLRYGQQVTIPPYIECGMGSVLALVEDWAWGECDHVFYQLPMFDSHDASALHRAYRAFIRVGGLLGLEPDTGSRHELRHVFAPVSEREIPTRVARVASRDADGQDWWVGWTGLAAKRAGAGFFASVAPTLNNQSRILGALANLYAYRAATIEQARNNALTLIQEATDALGHTQMVTTDRTNGWKTLQGFGVLVSIGGAWSVAGAAVGSMMVLTGFVGENLDPGSTVKVYGHDVAEVVGQLNDGVADLHATLEDHEQEYRRAVTSLRNGIHGVHSFNLELYDLTRNDPTGDRTESDRGFSADVDAILRLAESCYELGEKYQPLLRDIGGTVEADRSLADKDGAPTAADTALLEVRDQLESFLRKTAAVTSWRATRLRVE